MAEKILIVDDDIDSLKLIGLMLQRQGYEISAANSGMQAISKAAAEGPSLIILDVMMPDMDGYEVCRRLRANPATVDIPIIMFTAKTLVDDKVKGFEAGADDYLTKPTHPAELASRVKAVLARTAAKRDTVNNSQGVIIGVIGAKGGVGTTTVALNVATLLMRFGPTILSDFRLGQGSLGLALGLPRAAGLANLLTRPHSEINGRTISSELAPHNTGLRLLLSSTRPREAQINMPPEAGTAIIRHVRGLSKITVLDLGSSLTAVNQQVVRDVNHVLVVVDPQRITLAMGRSLIDALEEIGVGRGRTSSVLVSRTQSSLQISWQDAEKILGRDMQAIISPAPELAFQANEAGKPMVSLQPTAIISSQYKKLSEEIAKRIPITGG